MINNIILSFNVLDNNNLIKKIVKNSFPAFEGDSLYFYKKFENYVIVYDNLNNEIKYYIEIVNIKDTALINYISKNSINKYTLLTSLNNLKEIENIKVIMDNFSNSLLNNNYEKLYIFENLLRMSIINELIDEYKDNFKSYLKFIDYYGDKRKSISTKLNNIFHSADFNGLLKYIENNFLGGDEGNRYKEFINDKEKLKELNDKDIFKDLREKIGINESFCKRKEEILHFRNFIAHNKVVEDNLFEAKCINTIDSINDNLLTNYINKSIFSNLELNKNLLINGTLILLDKEIENEDEMKIYFMKILLELGIIPDIKIENRMLINSDANYIFKFYKAKKCNNIYILFINELYKEKITHIVEKTIKFLEKDSMELYYIFDFASYSYNKVLYKEFNIFESILRAYLCILDINKNKAYIVEDNNNDLEKNNRKKLLDKDKARLFLKENSSNQKDGNLINNKFFEEDTGKLRGYLTNYLDNNNSNLTVRDLIKKYISKGSKEDVIKKKLFTVIEWDTNLQIINNEWEKIEIYRNIVAHNNIIFKNELDSISLLMESVNKALLHSFINLLEQFYNITTNCIEIDNLKICYNKSNINYEDLNGINDSMYYRSIILFLNQVFNIKLNDNILFFYNDLLRRIIDIEKKDVALNKNIIRDSMENIFCKILIKDGKNNKFYLEQEINKIMDEIESKWN